MDNNVVASPRFHEIIEEIRDLGFLPEAKLSVGRVPIQRRVDFNQGVDARILCKSPMYLRDLSRICLKPLRIAFDHLGLKIPYEKAVRYAKEFGLTSMSNYMLYNFHDTPADLFERMRVSYLGFALKPASRVNTKTCARNKAMSLASAIKFPPRQT